MKIKLFQDGGAAPSAATPAPTGAPAPETGAPEQANQDPLAQIAQMFAQGLQSNDCSILAQGAQAFLQLVEQAGSAQPEGPTTQPVFAKGGKFKKRIPKEMKDDSTEKDTKKPFQKK